MIYDTRNEGFYFVHISLCRLQVSTISDETLIGYCLQLVNLI